MLEINSNMQLVILPLIAKVLKWAATCLPLEREAEVEANIIVFSFNLTSVFLKYIDKPDSAFDFMSKSQGNQSSKVDTGLIQSPQHSEF